MTVKVRKYKRGGWEVDIRFYRHDGEEVRVRKRAPVSSKSGAKRWGEDLERELMFPPAKPEKKKEVPTLKEFVPRYISGHCEANRQKPSHIYNVRLNIANHIIPQLGRTRLDKISNEAVQRLKSKLKDKSVKTVNNILSILNQILKVAAEWDVIEQMPCTIRLLKVPPPTYDFYEFDQYERLVEAAGRNDPRHEILVLLGGDAGLRRGEIIGLEYSDCDLVRGEITVERSDWRGNQTSPKGNRFRRVPMTSRLKQALKGHRHLRGPRVLYRANGEPPSAHILHTWMMKAQRRAGLKVTSGGLHILRHTFCSHLAMRGAPAKAIQELAGHKDLSTTLRYMHLSPAALNNAIKLLEAGHEGEIFGDILETGSSKIVTPGNSRG